MSGITIHRATLAEAHFVVQGNCDMALETESKVLDRGTVEAGVNHLISHPELGHYWLAMRNHEVLGQCMVTCEWSDWRCAPMWWFQSVYVIPKARRCGVFSALHQHVLTQAKAAGVAELRLYVEHDNQIAQRTYEQLGMQRSHYLMYEQSLTDL